MHEKGNCDDCVCDDCVCVCACVRVCVSNMGSLSREGAFSNPETVYIMLMEAQSLASLQCWYFVFLQVGRPNNVPQAAPIIAAIQEEAKKYPRIYVTSIHKDLTSEDVRRYAL